MLIECDSRDNFTSNGNYTGQHPSHYEINDFYYQEMDMPSPAYVFSQFLDLLPRYEFQHIVNKYQGDHRTKGFKCWNQLACMIFAHIRQEDSLRDIDIALNAYGKKLYHIGIKQCPRSTLADANARRDYRIYEEFAKSLMLRARRSYANTQLAMDVDNAVYALDASTIDLTLSLFPWAKFRATKGAIKLHTLIDLRGNIPAFLYITNGKGPRCQSSTSNSNRATRDLCGRSGVCRFRLAVVHRGN